MDMPHKTLARRLQMLAVWCFSGLMTFSAELRTPLLSSPSYGIFSLRSGEDSYALFTSALIGQLSSAGGNRLTASLRLQSAGAGNQFQLMSREWLAAGESSGESGLMTTIFQGHLLKVS